MLEQKIWYILFFPKIIQLHKIFPYVFIIIVGLWISKEVEMIFIDYIDRLSIGVK